MRGGLQRADDFSMVRSGEIPILSPMDAKFKM